MIFLYEILSIIIEGFYFFVFVFFLVLELKNNIKIGLYLIVCRVIMNDNSGLCSWLCDCGCDVELCVIVVLIMVC